MKLSAQLCFLAAWLAAASPLEVRQDPTGGDTSLQDVDVEDTMTLVPFDADILPPPSFLANSTLAGDDDDDDDDEGDDEHNAIDERDTTDSILAWSSKMDSGKFHVKKYTVQMHKNGKVRFYAHVDNNYKTRRYWRITCHVYDSQLRKYDFMQRGKVGKRAEDVKDSWEYQDGVETNWADIADGPREMHCGLKVQWRKFW
ncbi:hypothetical protein MKZ38_002202 [Zalerion maritima]|uniref:Uncharacterized protein n=1 Tax=Zalerion maritima TaxID=339359 RepID=A0AAD5WSL5_9PEZI|nr:hypothetical protein MKZ38_002202 [Zalerion maritima]